ncbi:MAG: DUF1559 domain-containing protein, partial [Pirellulales bacterium]|nr:DUF1559 domain-containing protein [Pirellulales bacterium]
SLTLIANGGAPGALAKRMQAVESNKAATAIVHPEIVDPSLFQNLAALDPDLAEVGPALQTINLLRGVPLTLGLSESLSLDLHIETNNEKSAQQLFALTLNGKNTLGQLLSVQALAGNAQNTGVPQELLNAGLKLLQSMKIGYQQNNVGLQVTVSNEIMAMLQDAVGVAQSGARGAQSQNNLKQIGLAVLNYSDTYDQYPNGESPNVQYDDNGKPLLSWRVHILPFIEEDALYRRFKLDEPWNSPHNLSLAEAIPRMYQHPAYPELANKTVYLATVAEEDQLKSAFGNWLTRPRDITDGEAQTVMFAEVAPIKARFWTQPDDVEINLSDVPGSLGFGPKDEINLLFCDGRIQEVPSDLMAATWRSLILRNDGQPIREQLAK